MCLRRIASEFWYLFDFVALLRVRSERFLAVWVILRYDYLDSFHR